MKRKLRKSLSWLLTVAMIFSLFCGMIPTASAADDPEIKEYHFMDRDAFEDLCLSKLGYGRDDMRPLTYVTITSIQLFANDGSMNGATAGDDDQFDMYNQYGLLTVGESAGEFIQPQDVAEIKVLINYYPTDKTIAQSAYVSLSMDDFETTLFPAAEYVELRVKEDEKPSPDEEPDAPSVIQLQSLFAEQIKVTCDNNHKTIAYGLGDVENGYSEPVGGVTKEDDVWTYTVTINYDPFVTKYSDDVVDGNDVEAHALVNPSVTTEDVKLLWGGEGWAAAESQLPVVIETICTNPQADYIQVNMSQKVEEKYESHGLTALERWTHVDTPELIKGYYEMGTDGRISNRANVSEDEITGVTMGWTTYDDEKMWFPMEGDNGIYAQVEVSYGYEGDNYVMYLYCQLVEERPEEPGTPEPPTDEKITDPNGILADAVKLDCSTDGHNEALYDIAANTVGENDSYTIGEVTGDAGTGYTCIITVNAVDSYLTQYNESYTSTNGHSYVDDTQAGTITLKWNSADKKWEVQAVSPVTFNVTCENEGGDTDHTITVNVTNGTVSYGSETDKTNLQFSVKDGGTAEITLKETSGYVLDYAVVDDVDVSKDIGPEGNYSFGNVTHDMTLTVVYAEDEKGTVDENGNETGDGIPDCRQVFIRYESANPSLGTVTPAFRTVNLERDKDQNLVIPDSIALTGVATAKEGARFVNWTQNDVFFADEANLQDCVLKTFAPGGTYTFYANFEIDTQIPNIFEIRVIVHNGTATYKEAPIVDYIPVFEGDSPAITFTPNPGYEFDKATLNGADILIPSDGTYTIKNVQENCTIEVWCTNSEEPEDPLTPPTDLEQLLEGYIHIQCADNPDHKTLNCGLLKDSYTVNGDGLGLQGNSYVIQIDSDNYAMYYDQVNKLDNIHTASGPNLIELTWDEPKWIVPKDGLTVKIFCNTEPEPEKPALPEGNEILNALKKSIIVECVTLPETHAKQSYDLIPGEYELEEASLKNDNGTWTLEVTVYPDSYLKLFNGTYQTSEGHVLVNQNDGLAGGKAILTYVDDSWTCLPGNGVTFAVKCSDGEPAEEQPSAPEHSTLAELIQVEVWCENLDAQHEKQEMALFGGTYSGTMSDSAPYTYTVTIESAPYIINFDKEGSYGEGTHHLVRALNDTVTLVWKDNNWQLEEGKNGVVQFYVTCKDEPQQPETYTVTFDSDGGSDVPSQKVVSGSCATEPTAPTKEGFTFAGWYLNDEEYDFNIPVSGNITLVAKWTENEPVNPDPEPETYIITATSGSNGTVDPSGETEVKKGDNLTISITPNWGYAVDTITVDGVERVNNGRGEWKVWDEWTFASVNADHDLYVTFARDRNGNGIPDKYEDHDWPDWPDWPDRPEWPDDPDDGDDDRDDASDPTYAVYYYPGYGSGARDLDKRYEEDMEVEVLAFEDVDLTGREGYTFIGWSTQPNAGSVTYLPGDTFDMPDHDVYLYAQWLRDQIGPEDTGVANWLNTTDHIAYLTGYPNGAFGPNNSMTRAEVAQMFYALLNNKNVTITATFPDVPADAWYATAVNTLASLGMVSGDADGNFRPNDPITRAEFCVIALAFAYEPENAVCYFGDVSRSDWFYTYVAQAASYGWIGGYADGSFGPNDLITRAQVTTIVNNMLGREADRSYVNNHADTLVQFNDLTSIHWAYYDIMEAVNEHEYTRTYGTEDWVE